MSFNVGSSANSLAHFPGFYDNFRYTLHPELVPTIPKTGIIPKHVLHQIAQPTLLRDDQMPLGIGHPHSQNYLQYRSLWNQLHDKKELTISSIQEKTDNLQIIIDIQQFSPEEIAVKVVNNNVVVEGSHDEKQDDHGWVTRTFNRRYLIPDDYDMEKIETKISSDGILIINAPRKKQEKDEEGRVIPIKVTYSPAI